MWMQKLVEEKLKVMLEAPPAPPSPVPEASETAELTNSSPTAMARTAGLSSAAAGTNAGASKLAGGAASGSDLVAENRQLREKLAMMELKSSETAAGKVGPAANAPGLGQQITLVHLAIAGIIAYVLGVYLH
jgi:hypothetical protein